MPSGGLQGSKAIQIHPPTPSLARKQIGVESRGRTKRTVTGRQTSMCHCGTCPLAFGARTGGGWVPAPLFGSSLTPVSDLVSRVCFFHLSNGQITCSSLGGCDGEDPPACSEQQKRPGIMWPPKVTSLKRLGLLGWTSRVFVTKQGGYCGDTYLFLHAWSKKGPRGGPGLCQLSVLTPRRVGHTPGVGVNSSS